MLRCRDHGQDIFLAQLAWAWLVRSKEICIASSRVYIHIFLFSGFLQHGVEDWAFLFSGKLFLQGITGWHG
jgi:hypothetical protein